MQHVNNFCVKEITNAHYSATLYHEIMQATPSIAPSKTEEIDIHPEIPTTDEETAEWK